MESRGAGCKHSTVSQAAHLEFYLFGAHLSSSPALATNLLLLSLHGRDRTTVLVTNSPFLFVGQRWWPGSPPRFQQHATCAAKGWRGILSGHKLCLASSFVSSHLKYCISCRLVRLEDIKVLEHLDDLESGFRAPRGPCVFWQGWEGRGAGEARWTLTSSWLVNHSG